MRHAVVTSEALGISLCPGSLLGNAAAGNRTRDLLIASPAP